MHNALGMHGSTRSFRRMMPELHPLSHFRKCESEMGSKKLATKKNHTQNLEGREKECSKGAHRVSARMRWTSAMTGRRFSGEFNPPNSTLAQPLTAMSERHSGLSPIFRSGGRVAEVASPAEAGHCKRGDHGCMACGHPRGGAGDRGGRRGMGATRRRVRGGGRPGLCNLELVFQITGNHGCCPSLGNVTLGTRGSAPAMYDAPAMNWNPSAEPRDPSATESRLRWRRVRVDAASSLAPEHAEPASPGSTTEYGADRFPPKSGSQRISSPQCLYSISCHADAFLPDLCKLEALRKWDSPRHTSAWCGFSILSFRSSGRDFQRPGWASTSRMMSPRSLTRLLWRRLESRQAAIFPVKVSSREATRSRMPWTSAGTDLEGKDA